MAPRKIFNGELARKLREDRNMNPAELLDRINEIDDFGWALNTIHGGELGRPVGLRLQHAWADALGVNRSELLMNAPEPDDTTP